MTDLSLYRLNRLRGTTFCAMALCVAGCGGLTPPTTGYVPSAEAQAAAYPALLDRTQVSGILGDAGPPRATVENKIDSLAARAAALRIRANALRAPVIPRQEAERLENAGRNAAINTR